MLPRITFIETLPQDASTRTRELQLAEARKHAATIAHLRRRGEIPNSRKHSKPKPRSVPLASTRAKQGVRWCRGAGTAVVTKLDDVIALVEDLKHEYLQDKLDNEGKAMSDYIRALTKRDLSKLVVSSHQLDPYYRIPHCGSQSFYEAVDFFAHTTLANNAPVYSIFNVHNIFSSLTFHYATRGHYLHLWMACMHLIRSMSAPETTSFQTALRYQGAGLSELQREVTHAADEADDITIGSVLFVALLARAYGNEQSHATHCNFLKKMVLKRGGLDKLGFNGTTKAAVLQWESFWALPTGESTLKGLRRMEPPIYPPLPLSAELQARVWKLPVGLQRLAYRGDLAIDVLELLERISTVIEDDDAFTRIPLAESVQTSSSSKHVDFWEACRCLAEPQPSLQKFLSLSLFLFCANEYSPKRQFRRGMTIFGAPRTLLTNELPKLIVRDVTEKECVMWIWMAVVDAWSSDCAQEGDLPPTGQSVLGAFRERFPEITSWELLRAVLRRFFWTQRFSKACQAYWAHKAV